MRYGVMLCSQNAGSQNIERDRALRMNILVYLAHCMDMRDFFHRSARRGFIEGLIPRGIFMPNCRANSVHIISSNVVDRTCNFYHSSFGMPFLQKDESWQTTHGQGGDNPKATGLPVTVPTYYGAFKELGFTVHMNGNGVDGSERCSMPDVEEWHYCTPAEINSILREDDMQLIFHKDRSTHRPWGHEAELSEWGSGDSIAGQRRYVTERPFDDQKLRLDGIRNLDDNFRDALDGVDLDNTIIVLWSNHGETYHYYHDMVEKPCWGLVSHGPGQTFEGLMRTMQLWLVPGLSSQVCLKLGRCIDIMPTLFALLGKSENFLPGVNLAEVWRGERAIETNLMTQITEWTYYKNPWKLMYYEDGGKTWPWPSNYLLFHLESDPTERNNLYGIEQFDEVVSSMLAEVEPWLSNEAKGKLL